MSYIDICLVSEQVFCREARYILIILCDFDQFCKSTDKSETHNMINLRDSLANILILTIALMRTSLLLPGFEIQIIFLLFS